MHVFLTGADYHEEFNETVYLRKPINRPFLPLSETKALIRSIKTIFSYGIYSGNFSCNWRRAKNICIAGPLDLEKHCDSWE